MIFLEIFVIGKNHTNLKFGKWAKKAEIMNFGAQKLTSIAVEIVFEFIGFRILVIDFGAVDGGLISAAFVRHDDVFFVGEVSDEIGCEGEHGAEGGMSVQETFAIESDELWVDGAFGEDGGVAASFNAGKIGLFRIEGKTGVVLRFCAEQLKADTGVFAAADSDEVSGGLDFWDGCGGRFMLDDEMNEFVLAGFDVVKIEELAKTIEIEFLEESKLFIGKEAGFDNEIRATGGFVIANRFDHAKVEGDGF